MNRFELFAYHFAQAVKCNRMFARRYHAREALFRLFERREG
jgi:hypothetical protein